MEPRGSWPHLQELATWAILVLFMPFHPTFLRLILISSSHLCVGFTSGLFTSGFHTKILYASVIFYTCCMLNPSNYSIQEYLVRNMDHYAPHCVDFSFPCYLVPHWPKYSSQHLILRHLQPTFLLSVRQYELWKCNSSVTTPALTILVKLVPLLGGFCTGWCILQ
jgi:hypothetical protein